MELENIGAVNYVHAIVALNPMLAKGIYSYLRLITKQQLD